MSAAKAALKERKGPPPPRQLATLEIDAADADASGYEPVWRSGSMAGFVTSGGYGHTIGKSLAMALVAPEAAPVGTELSVHIVGVERKARVIAPSPYDPAGQGDAGMTSEAPAASRPPETGSSHARRGRRGRDGAGPRRRADYRLLRNPFKPQSVFSDDRVAAIHQTALRVLEELGMRILLPEARWRFRDAGALVDEDSMMVRIGRDIVEAAALAGAPRAFTVRGGVRERDVPLELGLLTFQVGAGSPNATDIVRGRRPSTLGDLEDLVRINQHCDALQMLSMGVEAQDLPMHVRHYGVLRAELTLSDKVPYAFARSRLQARNSSQKLITDLEMVQIFAELCSATPADDAAIAFDALIEVRRAAIFLPPRIRCSGTSPRSMSRSSPTGRTSGPGPSEARATRPQRAHDVWTCIVAEFRPPPINAARIEELDAFIARRTEAGGAPPVS